MEKVSGRKTMIAGKDFRLVWDSVVYEPGVVKVVAYKDGREWATDEVKTTGSAIRISLSSDRDSLSSDGSDLAFITVKIQDRDGLTVPRTSSLIKFLIEGPGEIVATDNGDPTSFIPFFCHEREAFNGMALIIVKAKKASEGAFTVKAISSGLESGLMEIKIKLCPSRPPHFFLVLFQNKHVTINHEEESGYRCRILLWRYSRDFSQGFSAKAKHDCC